MPWNSWAAELFAVVMRMFSVGVPTYTTVDVPAVPTGFRPTTMGIAAAGESAPSAFSTTVPRTSVPVVGLMMSPELPIGGSLDDLEHFAASAVPVAPVIV